MAVNSNSPPPLCGEGSGVGRQTIVNKRVQWVKPQRGLFDWKLCAFKQRRYETWDERLWAKHMMGTYVVMMPWCRPYLYWS